MFSSLLDNTGLVIFLSYWLLGSVLLRLPPLFHNKKSHALTRSEIIAHRGSKCEGFAENSIAAFLDGAAAGSDVLELDVWVTADGEVR